MKNYTRKVVDKFGNCVYYDERDRYHRTDGPAIIGACGEQNWYIHGRKHRIGGPAVITLYQTKEWWINDEIHRIDGPAVIYSDGRKEWYVHGLKHRIDGPCWEEPNGTNTWWVANHRIGREQFKKLQEMRKVFHDDDLLSFLLLKGRIIL